MTLLETLSAVERAYNDAPAVPDIGVIYIYRNGTAHNSIYMSLFHETRKRGETPLQFISRLTAYMRNNESDYSGYPVEDTFARYKNSPVTFYKTSVWDKRQGELWSGAVTIDIITG